MDISEINIFFKKYAQAYLAFNSDVLVEFFHFPSLIHDLSGIHLLKNENDLKTYEKNFLENLKKQKISKIENELLQYDFSQQLPNAIGCKLAYKLFDVNNQLLIDFDYTYSLVKNKEWQILFARLGAVRKY
ncbi:MAG: hypothetical protein ACD_60C00043G0006 [uncultured bacterium]|nr:MAG: hypothetical protein ACD_60C00043G0006 [uncultured bacterium]